MVYFFPVRRIRAIESYHSELYTLEPTEQDQKALARFKSWVEKLGGEFEPAQATFRAVPPIYLGESHFSVSQSPKYGSDYNSQANHSTISYDPASILDLLASARRVSIQERVSRELK